MGILSGETLAAAREVPITLPLASDPSTPVLAHPWNNIGGGLTDQLFIRLPGGAYTNAVISRIIEKGYGDYAYQLTQAETAVKGDATIYAAVPNAQIYTGWEGIVTQTAGIFVGETVNLQRRINFHLPNAVNPMAGEVAHSFIAGEVMICLPGGVYTAADETRVVELGNGDYALELTSAQVANRGKIYLRAKIPTSQTWTSYTDIVPLASGSVIAANGVVLAITQGPLLRWTRVVAIVQLDAGDMLVVFESGGHRFVIYDGAKAAEYRWLESFADQSTIAIDSYGHLVVTILPNGGWHNEDVNFNFFAGTTMALAA